MASHSTLTVEANNGTNGDTTVVVASTSPTSSSIVPVAAGEDSDLSELRWLVGRLLGVVQPAVDKEHRMLISEQEKANEVLASAEQMKALAMAANVDLPQAMDLGNISRKHLAWIRDQLEDAQNWQLSWLSTFEPGEREIPQLLRQMLLAMRAGEKNRSDISTTFQRLETEAVEMFIQYLPSLTKEDTEMILPDCFQLTTVPFIPHMMTDHGIIFSQAMLDAARRFFRAHPVDESVLQELFMLGLDLSAMKAFNQPDQSLLQETRERAVAGIDTGKFHDLALPCWWNVSDAIRKNLLAASPNILIPPLVAIVSEYLDLDGRSTATADAPHAESNGSSISTTPSVPIHSAPHSSSTGGSSFCSAAVAEGATAMDALLRALESLDADESSAS